MSTGTGYLMGSLGSLLLIVGIMFWMTLVATQRQMRKLRAEVKASKEEAAHLRRSNTTLTKWRRTCVSTHGSEDEAIFVPLSTIQDEMRREVQESLRRDLHKKEVDAVLQSLMDDLDDIEKETP